MTQPVSVALPSRQRCDVLIAGSGVIGLAIAVELGSAGLQVAVVDRHQVGQASWAAAGMLAPQAEGLPPGPLQQLCQRSLALYPSWAADLESRSGLPSGYWNCGILQPVLDPDSSRPDLDRAALDRLQPGLAASVHGAFWLPAEGQVDNRLLVKALRQVALQVGVQLVEQTAILACHVEKERVTGLVTSAGIWQADTTILALGAWTGLLPMEDCWPVFPSKGQILAVEDRSHLLQHIVYGEGIYLVPRRQGRLIVGATVEEVGFQPGNTAGAVEQLLREAIALVPAIAEMPWLDLWWGFRPTTPDRAPILGQGPYHQLILATGHDRNGILLAPITAKLIGDQILQGNTDPILSAFSCSRWSPRPSAKD